MKTFRYHIEHSYFPSGDADRYWFLTYDEISVPDPYYTDLNKAIAGIERCKQYPWGEHKPDCFRVIKTSVLTTVAKVFMNT